MKVFQSWIVTTVTQFYEYTKKNRWIVKKKKNQEIIVEDLYYLKFKHYRAKYIVNNIWIKSFVQLMIF